MTGVGSFWSAGILPTDFELRSSNAGKVPALQGRGLTPPRPLPKLGGDENRNVPVPSYETTTLCDTARDAVPVGMQ